MRKFIN